MRCLFCGNSIYIEDYKRSICPSCQKIFMQDSIDLGAKYHTQGHLFECASKMGEGKLCSCNLNNPKATKGN